MVVILVFGAGNNVGTAATGENNLFHFDFVGIYSEMDFVKETILTAENILGRFDNL